MPDPVDPKKVLFIAYYFPPSGGGGVQRSSKFVKYLPRFGWIPLVLTVKEPFDYYLDDSLLEDISAEARVYRTAAIEPMKWVRKLLKKRAGQELQAGKSAHPIEKKSLKPGFLVKLKTILFVPDNEILWLPFAVWAGWKIIRREQPALIYSTASPFTDHLIAAILARVSGLPWAADFRDFWTDRANFPDSRWRRFIDGRLERWVLKRADHIVAATDLMAERFAQKSGRTDFTPITNGYDEADFLPWENIAAEKERFLIGYTGIFNREQNPANFFYAFRKLLDERPDFREKARLRLVGQLDNPGDFENYALFRKLKLDDYAEIAPYQPHDRIIKEMRRATVLFFLIGEYPHNEGVMTGKIFEYLRARRPILAVIPPGGTAARVLKAAGAALIVPNHDPDLIARGISEMFDLYLQGKLESAFQWKDIEQYERKQLTAKLAEVFEQQLAGRGVKIKD